jgi:hypothetical protein
MTQPSKVSSQTNAETYLGSNPTPLLPTFDLRCKWMLYDNLRTRSIRIDTPAVLTNRTSMQKHSHSSINEQNKQIQLAPEQLTAHSGTRKAPESPKRATPRWKDRGHRLDGWNQPRHNGRPGVRNHLREPATWGIVVAVAPSHNTVVKATGITPKTNDHWIWLQQDFHGEVLNSFFQIPWQVTPKLHAD